MHKEFIPDGVLLKIYIEGNEAALETLIRRHKSRIYTSIYLLVHDRYLAEDIFQETFIRIINCLRGGKYHHEDKFLPWALRIARNLAIDSIRHKGRTPMITTGDGVDVFTFIPTSDSNIDSDLSDKEDYQQLHKLINQLPEEQKEVLVLRHYADLSFKEIADMTGTNINTCIGRMHYALINLRKMMQKNLVRVK
jgi:RNA polymerase sigma-70 factor (ECF subfamily)